MFSEAMRDVDLFVGVTSIAADPDWREHGPERAYWERTAFGELSETAATRRDALERLLPRLKIADRCMLEDRFLVVRGDRGTYKIHLLSANILMEPDDAYLCIVPAFSRGERYLPFEDDRLSLILSKAFLLAADAEHGRVHPHAARAGGLMATVTFRDETPMGRPLREWRSTGLPDRMTVRALIRRRASEQAAHPIDWERAFLTNGFFLLVDDRQADSLDEEVDLTTTPTLIFIKLVALAGG
ncbi:hypothetical protein SHKM778_16650 [Streptomyces sp. KM77-8]|uniref:DUF7737 domain-containing protein n=1 Tax=Streptomyces haneummycinicus TaxID=3074435 RepID=A0AAT9HD48_9ACTN